MQILTTEELLHVIYKLVNLFIGETGFYLYLLLERTRENWTIKNCCRQQFDKAGKHFRVVRHSKIPFCESWKIFWKVSMAWVQWKQPLIHQISCRVNIPAMPSAMELYETNIHAWFQSVFVLGVNKVRLFADWK